jgi:hypothetical protein
MSKFVECARDQAFLLPPDLRDWVPEDDLAHFVIEAVLTISKEFLQFRETAEIGHDGNVDVS